jgi:curved DNA-binding protein CbpA
MTSTTFAQADLYQRLGIDPAAPSGAIKSAYRMLAHRLHPDRNASPTAHRAMAQLNEAYATLRDPDRRQAYDRQRSGPVVPPAPRPSQYDAAGRMVLDFGRFQGWALTEVARREPEYLEWLRRHSSGVRYRREIDRVLSERTTARR